jgi:hypothetical protein
VDIHEIHLGGDAVQSDLEVIFLILYVQPFQYDERSNPEVDAQLEQVNMGA